MEITPPDHNTPRTYGDLYFGARSAVLRRWTLDDARLVFWLGALLAPCAAPPARAGARREYVPVAQRRASRAAAGFFGARGAR